MWLRFISALRGSSCSCNPLCIVILMLMRDTELGLSRFIPTAVAGGLHAAALKQHRHEWKWRRSIKSTSASHSFISAPVFLHPLHHKECSVGLNVKRSLHGHQKAFAATVEFLGFLAAARSYIEVRECPRLKSCNRMEAGYV